MAALLVLLLLLAVPLTAFTTTDVYYVTAHDAAGYEQSCPPHQICHNLSYYISKADSYFTSDTTIIFLEGEHSFDREDPVHVSNVHNLTLKGQGQWPVAGAEETVRGTANNSSNTSSAAISWWSCRSVTFSGNRAGKGGSDIYGAILMGCDDNVSSYVPHVGQPNETSWYFRHSFQETTSFQ